MERKDSMPYIKTHSTYLEGVRKWKVCHLIASYLRARQAYLVIRHTVIKSQHLPSFESLKEISDILFEIKEEHRILYQRIEEIGKDNSQHKLIPDFSETAFIDHVGLLFHNIMAARELRYILQKYAHDKEKWGANFDELRLSLQGIEALFKEGLDIIKNLIQTHFDNEVLLAYLYENSTWIGPILNIKPAKLMQKLVNQADLPRTYSLFAQYYYKSGWYDRAHKVYEKILEHDPQHKSALSHLKKIAAKDKN